MGATGSKAFAAPPLTRGQHSLMEGFRNSS